MRALLILLFAAIMIAVGALMELERFKDTPLTLVEESVLLDVPSGMSLRGLSDALASRGLMDHPFYFMVLSHWRGDASRIKAGEYEIAGGTTPLQLLDQLIAGKVVQRAITLVEGWTIAQALEAVIADERLKKTLEEPTTKALMVAIGQPDLHAEGRFFPDTYHFTKGASDVDIMQRAFASMERVLAEEWEKRDDGLPLASPYEALILASIIEKETGKASERPAIAGVFVRRLINGMKLQTDPTVIYGMGDAFDGNLRRADLRRDTPYNTYVHHELPPTPIALPGRAAIHATVHPQDDDSLYFVAKGDGSHWFSATLDEHNRAVRRYQFGQH